MTELPQELRDAGWTPGDDGKSISKTYRFGNFREAFAWMVRAAFEAEGMNHHPDWKNVYNRVEVSLTTHEKGRLTDTDIELARRFEKLGPPGA